MGNLAARICLILIISIPQIIHASSPLFVTDWMKEALKTINDYRAMHGISPLCLNLWLGEAARGGARGMAGQKRFNPDPVIETKDIIKLSGFLPIISDMNFRSRKVCGGTRLPQFLEAIQAWNNVLGYQPIMLNPYMTHVGFGEAMNDEKTWYASVIYFAASATERCDYEYQSSVPATTKPVNFATSHFYRLASWAFAKSGEPLYTPLYKAVLEQPTRFNPSFPGENLDALVRKYWDKMYLLPPDTVGYKRWVQLGGQLKPGQTPTNVPTTPTVPTSSMPPTTKPSQPTSPRASQLAAEMVRQEQKQGDSPLAKQATPNDLNKAIIEHDQNSAMGQQQSSAEGLQQRLLDPQMILLISGAIVALGLLWYFRGQISAFIKSAYEKTFNWIFGVKKNQRVGTDALAKEAKTMAKLVAKKDPKSQPLLNGTQILKMKGEKITFKEFESLLGDAVRDLNFHNLEILLENMLLIVKEDELVIAGTDSLSTAKANAILDYITMGQVPSSLLETFILKSGHYSGKSLSPEIRQVIKDKVALRPPIYQTSALILLGKYGLSPEEMKISVSIKYKKYVRSQFANMVTKLVQNYFEPQENLRLNRDKISQLKDSEISMFEKLLKRTKCINPRMKNKLSCLPLVKTIQSFGPRITNRLQTISAPHLAYLLAVKDEQAYEDDLGMYMLAKGELGIPDSKRRVRPEAQLLRTLFSQGQKEIFPACRDPNDRTDVKAFPVPPKWKSQIDTLNVEVRRGFARALIYWGLQIPPYALPRIHFANNDLSSMFRDYLKAYCGQKKQVPATSIVFLDEDPKKLQAIER